MAVSTCVKCSAHSLEVVLFTPIGDNRKLSIVQCSTCGTPIGMMDPATGLEIEALEAQVAAIDDRLSRIARALQSVRAPHFRSQSTGRQYQIRDVPAGANTSTPDRLGPFAFRRGLRRWPAVVRSMPHCCRSPTAVPTSGRGRRNEFDRVSSNRFSAITTPSH